MGIRECFDECLWVGYWNFDVFIELDDDFSEGTARMDDVDMVDLVSHLEYTLSSIHKLQSQVVDYLLHRVIRYEPESWWVFDCVWEHLLVVGQVDSKERLVVKFRNGHDASVRLHSILRRVLEYAILQELWVHDLAFSVCFAFAVELAILDDPDWSRW